MNKNNCNIEENWDSEDWNMNVSKYLENCLIYCIHILYILYIHNCYFYKFRSI